MSADGSIFNVCIRHPICEVCEWDGTRLIGGCIILTENMIMPSVVCRDCQDLAYRMIALYSTRNEMSNGTSGSKHGNIKRRAHIRKALKNLSTRQRMSILCIQPESLHMNVKMVLNLLADANIQKHPRYPDRLYSMLFTILTGSSAVFGDHVKLVPFEKESVAVMRVRLLQHMYRDDIVLVFESIPTGEDSVRMIPTLVSRQKYKNYVKFRCRQCDKELRGNDNFKCGTCMVFNYCSKDCQRKHWAIHKSYCTPYADINKYFEIFKDISSNV